VASAARGDCPDVCAQDGDGLYGRDDGGRRGLVERWSGPGDGTTIDIAPEMAKVTLDVVERTIISNGFRSDVEAIHLAMTTYFNTIGKISPLDVLGVPDFMPRLSRFQVRWMLRFFEAELDWVISARRRILAEQPDSAPNDLLTICCRLSIRQAKTDFAKSRCAPTS
jgi:hypothetical protein